MWSSTAIAQCDYPYTSWQTSWIDSNGAVQSQSISRPPAKQGTYYAIFPRGGQGPCQLCPSSHANCNQGGYDHVHFPSSMFDLDTTVNMQPVKVTASAVEAYWLTVYKSADGYTPSGSASFAKNCYGYAYGIDAMVQDGAYGVERLINAGGSPPCYDNVTDFSKVEIATMSTHAIVVSGRNCPTASSTPIPAILTSIEKNRESQIFSRTGSCPTGIGLIYGRGNYTYVKKH